MWCCNTGDIGPMAGRANRTNTTCCTISDLLFTALDPVVFTTASFYGSAFPVGTMVPSPISASDTASISPSTAAPLQTNAMSSTPSTAASKASVTGTSKLAIGLGVGIGALAAIALCFGFFCLRRKRTGHSSLHRRTIATKDVHDISLVETSNRNVAEMRAIEPRTELTCSAPPAEMWAPVQTAELEGEVERRSDIADR
jgi:hypothetical protein